MKSIVLPAYNANIIRAMRSLEVIEKAVPQVKSNQVLIKVLAAPCNPSDIAFMLGGYSVKKPTPVVMGFEGCGIVEDAGPDQKAQKMIGKKVSFFTQDDEDGSWAEYLATDFNNCILLKDEIDTDQAAALCINPFTAYLLFDMAVRKDSRTIIQNAATGQVAEFIRNIACREGFQLINLVRKEEHVSLLKDGGQAYVINMNDENAYNELRELSHELKATIAFDAVGGPHSGLIFDAMPKDAELIVYGGLSDKATGPLNTMDIIFENKSVKGFNLTEWIANTDADKFNRIADKIQDMVIDRTIETRIQGWFNLEDVQSALTQYIKNMSDGKVLFVEHMQD